MSEMKINIKLPKEIKGAIADSIWYTEYYAKLMEYDKERFYPDCQYFTGQLDLLEKFFGNEVIEKFKETRKYKKLLKDVAKSATSRIEVEKRRSNSNENDISIIE